MSGNPVPDNPDPEAGPENVHDPVEVFFDAMLLPEETLLCHVVVSRHGQRSHIDFQLSLAALRTADPERLELLHDCLQRWNRQQGDSAWVISRLLDIALEQQGILEKEKRDKQVRDLMLYGLKPSTPVLPERSAKSRKQKATIASEGISPLLLFISRRTRRRLTQQHGINVDELQKESEQLYRDVGRFWEIIPPEPIPTPGRYFSYAAEQFDKRVLAHHQKVRHVGELLGGELGKTLTMMAELGIKSLAASREETASPGF